MRNARLEERVSALELKVGGPNALATKLVSEKLGKLKYNLDNTVSDLDSLKKDFSELLMYLELEFKTREPRFLGKKGREE